MKHEIDGLVSRMHTAGVPFEDAVKQFERQYIQHVLVKYRGNQCKAAVELGMHRNTLGRKMTELGLTMNEVRALFKRPVRNERPVFSEPRKLAR